MQVPCDPPCSSFSPGGERRFTSSLSPLYRALPDQPPHCVAPGLHGSSPSGFQTGSDRNGPRRPSGGGAGPVVPGPDEGVTGGDDTPTAFLAVGRGAHYRTMRSHATADPDDDTDRERRCRRRYARCREGANRCSTAQAPRRSLAQAPAYRPRDSPASRSGYRHAGLQTGSNSRHSDSGRNGCRSGLPPSPPPEGASILQPAFVSSARPDVTRGD